MTKPKWKRGSTIRGVGTLVEEMEAGMMVFYLHKCYHPGFIYSWTFRFIINGVKKGHFATAVRIKHGIEVEQDG